MNRARPRLRWLPVVWVVVVLGLARIGWSQVQPPPVTAEELRRELNRLRSDYETRIRGIERQLEELERRGAAAAPSPATNTTTAPAVPTTPPSKANTNTNTNTTATGENRRLEEATAHASSSSTDARRRRQLDDAFQRTTESRDIAREQARDELIQRRLQTILDDFVDFTGYFRAGYGRNDEGGVQTPFKAPGAQTKYRLGNETENYGELALGKNFYVPGLFSSKERGVESESDDLSGPIARFQFRLAFGSPYSGGTDLTVPEAWASIGNVLGSQPGAKFWAGNRFYRRHDIHISDFFFYNMAGKGGGLEDVDLGFGKAALAWIGESSQDATYGDIILPDPANKSGFAKSNWDLRLYDVKLPLGTGEFGATVANAEGGEDEFGNTVDGALGVAFNFVHTAEGFLDDRSLNKFSVQVGTGPARTFGSGFEVYDSGGRLYILPELADSWRLRVTEHFILQPYEWLSIGPVLAYEYTDFDQQAAFGGWRHWVSGGVRPVVHFTKNLGLALEGGIDWTHNDGQVDGSPDASGALWKITLAPQVSLDRFFLSRPVIRLYVTYAGWADAYRGAIGGSDYTDRTDGLAFGIQMEAWW